MYLVPPKHPRPDFGSEFLKTSTSSTTNTATTRVVIQIVQAQKVKDDPTVNPIENNWIFYTEVGACVLLGLISVVIIFDLCCRWCCSRNEQEVSDGGAPPSPGHNHSYVVEICADEASPTFDANQSLIRMELLDMDNQYLTSIAVPCFVLKFKTSSRRSDDKGSPPHSAAPPPPSPQTPTGVLSKGPQVYKSMTSLMERWSNTSRSQQISFFLVKRLPLKDFGAIRITHDCFHHNAYITLKHVIVREDATKSIVKIDLQGKVIRALHPCPPTGAQVFTADRSVAYQQV